MLEILKVAVEPLVQETFAPFGQVISSFDEAKPEAVVGALTENAYTRPNDSRTRPVHRTTQRPFRLS